MSKWQMTRVQYGFGLGILVATWIHFPAPRALFAFGVASALTSLRFNALGWKPWKALLPFAIAACGTALILMVGTHSRASVSIAHFWRFAAISTQLGMIVRAVLAYAAVDPKSPKVALLTDTIAKRRALIELGREAKPIQAERERAYANMMALHDELRLHCQKHGFGPNPEQEAIRDRMAAQQEELDSIRAIETEHHERRRKAAESLTAATKALKGSRRAA